MNQSDGISALRHRIEMSARKQMNIEGVTDVLSFDEGQVTLITCCGELMVEGSELHISVLDLEKGRVELSGMIDGAYYSDTAADGEKQTGFFKRLFG